MAFNVASLSKNLPGKVISKAIKSIPGVGTISNIGGGLGDIASGVGKALGLGKTEADRRKDRTRAFHDALRRGDWSHIERTAEAEGKLGGRGTRFKGLALEALWVLQQRALGYGLPEIRAAIAGNGGAEARGGRLPNLDGSPNTTVQQWQNTRGSAGAVAFVDPTTATPVLMSEDSAPVARKTRRSTAQPSALTSSRTVSASAPRAPRPKPPCAYGPRGADGYCPKKPKKVVTDAQGFVVQGGRAAKPCAYGPRGADGYCPKKPRATRATRAETAARKKVETAVATGLQKGAQYIYKNFGVLGPLKVLAKASLVGAAGIGAYALTKKLLTLRPKTWQDAKNALAQATVAARAEVRKAMPYLDWEDPAVNAQHMAQFNEYFRERKGILDRLEAIGAKPNLGYTFDDDNPTYGDPYKN